MQPKPDFLKKSPRIQCATFSLQTYFQTGLISDPCKLSWATPASSPRKFIRMSQTGTCTIYTKNFIIKNEQSLSNPNYSFHNYCIGILFTFSGRLEHHINIYIHLLCSTIYTG